MKTIIVFLLFVVLAVYFNGCTGSQDRFVEGPPKLGEDGKKVSGDNFYLYEWLELQYAKSIARMLNDTTSKTNNTNTIPDSLPGYIINESSQYLNVVIYLNDQKTTKVKPALLYPHTWMQVYLKPFLGYYAEFDGGLGSHPFDVIPGQQAPTTTPGIPTGGYFYLYKTK